MSDKPEEYVVDAWIALLRAKNHAFGHVEKTLKESGLPPFSWYDVLLELELASPGGLRPFEVEQRLLLSQYGLSRLLRRLQKAGYVKRAPCSEDRRGHTVSITPEGRQIRRKMWVVYSGAIQAAIGDKLTEAQCRELKTLLGPLQSRPDRRQPQFSGYVDDVLRKKLDDQGSV